MTVTLPDELIEALPKTGGTPDRRVLVSLVLDLYRKGAISAGKVAGLLGFSRVEADKFLGEHGLLESPAHESCAEDHRKLEVLLGR